MSAPFFSIILPTYNRARYIERSISSALDQTFKNFEIIVVDDGSTDNTIEIVNQIKDNRIRYFYKENEERGVARNYGITKAVGKYLTFLDSDDIIYAHHLQTGYEKILELGSPEVFHLDYEFKLVNGKIISRGIKLPLLLNHHLLENSQIGVLGVFIRNDIAARFQFIAHRSAIVAEDLYLWLILASRYPFHHTSQVTGAIMLHEERSLNDRNAFKFLKSAILIMRNLSMDDAFIKFYTKRRVNFFYAKNLVQVALMYAEQEKSKWTFKLISIAVSYSWRILFNRTFLAVLRISMKRSAQ
jgi:glycosyltransferase involved in cell wall biosynthesis